jgi:hypothetical protein
MNVQPVLLDRIQFATGDQTEDGSLVAVEVKISCALPTDGSEYRLAEWIAAYFERRDQ